VDFGVAVIAVVPVHRQRASGCRAALHSVTPGVAVPVLIEPVEPCVHRVLVDLAVAVLVDAIAVLVGVGVDRLVQVVAVHVGFDTISVEVLDRRVGAGVGAHPAQR